MEFLEQIARQVAVAVDNTLRHRDARVLQEQLQHERDRLRLLLRLNNSFVSNLDLRALLRAVSASLRRVMDCDSVIMFLAESERDKLRIYALDFPASKGFLQEETLMSMEGLHGMVYRTGKPWAGNIHDLAESHPGAKLAAAEGIQFVSIMPPAKRRSLSTMPWNIAK